jgi:diguanylate cyclase (GGDEF)-like protein
MDNSTGWKLSAGFAGILLLIVPLGFVSYRTYSRQESRSLETRSFDSNASSDLPPAKVVAFGALLGLSLVGLSGFLIGRDLAGRKKAEAVLREMAAVDELTGLYNRRGFVAHATDLLGLAGRMGRPAIVFLADVDGLKAINDRFGHASGDLALAGAARVLQLTFRSSDVIARLGGDEFAVLAIVDSRDGGGGILHRLQKNVDLWNSRSQQPFAVSLSTGLVFMDPSSQTLEKILTEADRVMYETKESRKSLHA